MVAKVKRLVPEATTLVALVIPSSASLSWGPFKFALTSLEGKAQRTVVTVMGHTTLRDLDLGSWWLAITLTFSTTLAAFLGPLLFQGPRCARRWSFMNFLSW
jgi:hypothetical protein